MGVPSEPLPVKPVVSIIFADLSLGAGAREAMCERLGKEDFVSNDLPFDKTRYYEEEMGTRLKRIFVSYAKPSERESLVEAKLSSHRIESVFSAGGKRRVNIDPGYISLENLVLSTFKGYSHRIYLGKGVFAEVTLIFEKGSFRPLRWTYPDYASEEVINIMNGIRERYRTQVGHESP